MLVATFIYSINGVFIHEVRPGSIEEALGGIGTNLWSIALFIGTLIALIGIAWPERATGLTMESIGLLSSGAATLLYGIAALAMLGTVATFPVSIIFGYGLSCVWRALQIRAFMRTIRESSGEL